MRRWRPSLAFVLAGALAGTLALSLSGLVALRYLGPEIGFLTAAAILAGLILAATAGLGWLLVRLLLRPIRALESYALAQATAEGTVPRHYGTRETHRTALAVIGMAEALRDRAATLRTFTDHVVHELRTPVSAIRAATELLQDMDPQEPEARLLAQIDGARMQMEARLQALRDIARAREARYLGTTTLEAVLPALDSPLALTVSGGSVAIPLSAEGLQVVLGHLLDNAAQNGARRVDLAATTTAGGGTELIVADDGPGISAGNAPRVFDPFFTTRRDSGGTGMGLAILRSLLAAHRARIDLVPAPTGASFRIAFAPEPDRAGAAAGAADAQRPPA